MNIKIHNPSHEEATSWVFVGLPQKHMPSEEHGVLTNGAAFCPYVRCRGGIHVRATVAGKGTLMLFSPKVPTQDPAYEQFVVHPDVDLAKLVPWWWYEGENAEVPQYWAPDAPKPGPSFFRVVEHSAAHQLWHVRCRHPKTRLTHDLWATIYSNQSTIEFVAHTVYGTTANDGQPQQIGLGQLWLLSHYPMHMDFAVRNGLSTPAGQNPDGTWAFPLARPQMLHRARRIETRGAILCSPNTARQAGRMRGQLLARDWEGSWLSLGAIPNTGNPWLVNAVWLLEMEAQHNLPGSYWQPRPQCQPPWSNTTGEQVGFGATACGQVLVSDRLIDYMLWNTQSYAMRPTANKEPDGEPMAAARHPHAETMGMRPDLNWGALDRLGWPPPGQLAWIDGYVTSDDEHRDDTTLHAMIALTQCPGLRAIAEDHIQLGLTEVRLKLGWPPAARATGRLLLAYANAKHLGIADTSLLMKITSEISRVSFPGGGEDAVIGPIGEAKYGWVDEQGRPVMGWQPWQQAIAAIGFLAAGRVTGDDGFYERAAIAARAAVMQGFRGPGLRHVYAVSVSGEVREDNAADYWTAAAAFVVEALGSERVGDAVFERAALIRDAFGSPHNWARAHWWAVVR